MELIDRAAREWTFLRSIVRVLRRVAPIARNKQRTLRDLADEVAGRFGDRVALQSEDEALTFRQWNAHGHRYGRWALGQGIAKGDVVALLMPNRPRYCAVWLGIARIGGVTALINTNLTGAALAHSLNIVGAKLAVVDATLLPRYEAAVPYLDRPVTLVVEGVNERGLVPLEEQLADVSFAPIPAAELPPLTIDDRCLYVYTSGTTGRPKAATINHYRVQLIMHGFAAVTNATAADRIYDALPMYHTNGGVIAPGIALMSGGTCIIKDRFSARDFWPDLARHKATMFIYIGELCRYLVHTPPSEADRNHRVRLCVGNGLRPDVWPAFADRFGLKRIVEFYAATEGNCSMFNFDSRPGAVGRLPPWIVQRFPMRIVRFDVESEEVVRGPDGRCLEAAAGEPGELIGEILEDPKKPGNRFDGYSDGRATETKVLRDVFAPGDAWFRTGDLLRKDEQGYHFFVDRIGDTFRWKGENVSTSEVAEAIAGFPAVQDVTVYGVRVPGRDGRAGMASIVVERLQGFDFAGFAAFLRERLPDYAAPLFLRFPAELALTGTFKQRKTDLVRDGFDPAAVSDPLYVRHPATRSFVPLDAPIADSIARGILRL